MILIHYGEIGIKGKNRAVFENCLVRNIRRALKGEVVKIRREYGRILVEEKKDANLNFIRERLSKIPGIENFSFVTIASPDIEDIKEKAFHIAKKASFSTFRIAARRASKNFPYTSMKVNEIVGEEIRRKLGKKVNLENPDLTIFIEIGDKEVYVYKEKLKGMGGLPVGSQGKVVALLSGGIDSPVASWLMMKRGCSVIFVHFYNENLVASPKKIEEIIEKLTEYQMESKAYFIPFGEMQYEIVAKIAAKYRMIIYRRVMARVAEKIASREEAKAIVTGDSIGQVASQTIDNILCIYAASNLPVLPPLIGMDKKEIVDMAKKIGTYEYSIKAYDDCCSFMVAKHPATKANLQDIEKMEERIEMDIERIMERAEIKEFSL
ncbi:MAG TPA: tRNA 4-thiouridine(8) synthase ThiI [Thermoplasmatales archaeon]|nr:tRNA 4-thiouridine(8) synthase ThiI [Thermoplasmatales archaeon]